MPMARSGTKSGFPLSLRHAALLAKSATCTKTFHPFGMLKNWGWAITPVRPRTSIAAAFSLQPPSRYL